MDAVILKMDRLAEIDEQGIYTLQIPGKKGKWEERKVRAIHISGEKIGKPVDMYVVIEDPALHEAFENSTILINLLLEDIMKWEQRPWWALIGKGIARIFGVK